MAFKLGWIFKGVLAAVLFEFRLEVEGFRVEVEMLGAKVRLPKVYLLLCSGLMVVECYLNPSCVRLTDRVLVCVESHFVTVLFSL